MRKVLIGAGLALFALAPALSWADCGVDHAAMASSTPAAPADVAQAPTTQKASAMRVATKTNATRHVKRVAGKATSSPPKVADGSTVVAKTN